jgi:hypothetical protein
MEMEIVLFNLFSTIEGVAIFSVMLHLFRFKLSTYLKEIIIFSIIMSVLSYFIREDPSQAWVVPILMILISIGFIFVILRIPLFWSGVVVCSAYVIFVITQIILVLLFSTLGVITLENVESNTWNTYFIQVLEFLILFPGSLFLYRRGYGFAYSFDRFRWKRDNIIFILLMLSFIIFFGTVLINKQIFLGAVILILTFVGLLVMSFRKEKESEVSFKPISSSSEKIKS